jgi:hypothetical protein
VSTRYIHPVRRSNIPRVAHWMPAGSTLVPCRAGTRELATVARDVHAASNPQHHTVDTQASAEVGWFYEGGGRTWAMAGASMLMRSTALRMVNNVEVIRDMVVKGELAEVGLKLDQTRPHAPLSPLYYHVPYLHVCRRRCERHAPHARTRHGPSEPAHPSFPLKRERDSARMEPWS